MAKSSNSSGARGMGGRSTSGSYHSASAAVSRGASAAQLAQRSGTTLGGVTKVAKSDGGYTMQKSK